MDKNKITLGLILMSVFILGYLISSLIHKNKSIECINETEILITHYADSPFAIDSIERASKSFYDTANVEMLHYVLNYNDKNISKFPEYYVTNFGDTVEYNKENFFYYVAMYTVSENLLETRKHIINGLLMNVHIEKDNEIREKIQK